MADAAVNPFSDPNFGSQNANPFSDPDFGKPASVTRRVVGDSATALLKGIPQVGQTAYQLGDALSGGALDKASTGLTGGIADLAATVGDALTGGKVGQVYKAGSTDAMFGGAPATPQVGIQGERLSAGFNRVDDAIGELYSKDQQAANQKVADAKGFLPTVAAALRNPSTITTGAIQSLPVSLGMMGGVRMLAERAGVAAAAKATEAGLEASAVAAARNAAIEKFSTGAPGIAAQMGADFAVSGAQQASQAKDAINALPEEELQQSPMYQQLRRTMTPEDAREQLANNGQFRAFITAGTLSALTSPISSSLEGKAATAGLRDKAAQVAARDFLGIKGVGKAIGTEGLQETLQSGGEQVGTNAGMTVVDPNFDLTKDVGSQAAAGGLSGALMGAAFHAVGHAGERGPVRAADGTTIDPSAGMLSAGAAAAANNRAEPALALPGPDTAFPGGPMITAPDGTTRAATYSDMTQTRIQAGREADGLSQSRTMTENHLQHAVDLGMTYGLDDAQHIAQVYGERHDTEMAVMPTPDGKFAAIPKAWVAPAMLRDQQEIQPGPRRLALPNPDAPLEDAGFIADASGSARRVTGRDLAARAQDFRARQAQADADLASGNTPDVRAAAERRANPTTEGERNARDEEARPADEARPRIDAATGLHPDGLGRDGRSDVDAGQGRAADDVVAAGNDEAGNVEGQGDQGPAAFGQRRSEGQDALIDDAAHQAATSPLNDRPLPTQAQIEAGNYAKGHLALQGLDISIENPAGSTRSGVSRTGKPWSTVVQHHYGYIRGTVGRDGDHIDTFIGPNHESAQAFVVDQKDPATNRFDEHKVMLGFDSADDAKAAYMANHEKGWKGLQAITSTSTSDLKRWLANGNTRTPFRFQALTGRGVKQIVAKPEKASIKRGTPAAIDATNTPPAATPASPAKQANAEKAATGKGEAAPRKKNEPTHASPLITAIANAGGIRLDLRSDITGAAKGNQMIRYFGPLFRKNGLQIDELAARMVEDGFMTQGEVDSDRDNGGANRLMALIGAELRDPGSTTAGPSIEDAAEARANREYEDGIRDEAEAAGFATKGASIDDLLDQLAALHTTASYSDDERAAAGYDDLTDDERNAVDVDLYADDGGSEADMMRSLGFSQDEIDEAIKQSEEIRRPGADGEAFPGEPEEGRRGGPRVAEETGQALTVEESKDDPYTKDLFAESAQQRPAPEQPAAVPSRNAGDVDPADGLKGVFGTTTKVISEVQRKLGATRVTNAQEAANALAYLGRYAIERFDGLVTDRDGKPLAIVGSFKGTVAATAVYPATIVGEASRVPGAANIWFAHNHPSGNPTLSNADLSLNRLLRDVFRGSGIQTHGIMAIGSATDGKHSFTMDDEGMPKVQAGIAAPAEDGASVGALERVFDKHGKLGPVVAATADAVRLVKSLLNNRRGIVLLDSQMHPIGAVPLDTTAKYGRIRDTPQMMALMRIASKSGAGAAIISQGSMTVDDARNVASFLGRLDINVADTVTSKGESYAQMGRNNGAHGGVFYDAEAPIFRSALAEAIDTKAPFAKDGTIGAGQLRMWLAARAKDGTVKADEIAATGIDDYLRLEPGKVSRATLADFMADNGVKVTETMLGGDDLPPLPNDWSWSHDLDGYHILDADGDEQGTGDTYRDAHMNAMDVDETVDRTKPRFAGYTLPGGKNYRELLLTLPDQGSDLDMAKARAAREGLSWNDMPAAQKAAYTMEAHASAKPEFRATQHFDQPNILAHVRFDDRTDADGKKVLFLEELQSDWAQQGKKRGFGDSVTDRIIKDGTAALERNDTLGFDTVDEARQAVRVSGLDQWDVDPADRPAIQAFFDLTAEQRRGTGQSVPSGPFVGKTEAWVSLALKRMIRYAAENGYDRVAWTTGEQQNARYPVEGAQGDKIASGMQGFYDRIVPNIANDVLKKLGGDRVGDVALEPRLPTTDEISAHQKVTDDDNSYPPKVGLTQPGFDITPKLRETVMKGVPLFDRAPAAGGNVKTAADQAVNQAAAKGETAKTLLAELGRTGSTPYNRILARALLATGVDSKISFGTPAGMLFAHPDVKMAAAYRPGSDAVTFFGTSDLEKHALHELTHAATVNAIRAGGTASVELDRLFAAVKASHDIDQSLYGLRDRFEFIAEAFSNPRFQDALRAVEAPVGKRSLWDSFVNLVRRALGLQDGNALSEALRVGANLMRENQAVTRPAAATVFGDVEQPLTGAVRDSFVQSVRQRVSDQFQSQKTVSWWHRTIGTMYHFAQVNPQFKPVYELGQRFIQDISQIAMNASDLAPSWLPKMGSLRDIVRRGVGKTDANAVAAAFFQGTREGERFSDDVLRSRFGMTDPQVALFGEARAAVDHMLDETAASEIYRLARKTLDPATLAAIKADPANAASTALAALAGKDSELATMIQGKVDAMAKLKSEGYAPLSRFGQHTVYAVDQDGKQLYYDMKESQAAANALARTLKTNFPDATVTQGILSQEAWKAFQGMNPDSIELFAEAMGVDADEAFQTYIRNAVNNRSTLKRMTHRATGADGLSGIEGYSQDVPRVLASFVTSSARMAAKNYSMTEMREAVTAIPKENGDVIDMAEKLRGYLQSPQQEAPALRGFLFTHFIGGSIASAITNMTQPVLQTFPYLSQFGTGRAAAALGKGAAMAASNTKGDAVLEAAMRQAEKDGVLAPHELHQLYAESIRGFGSNEYLRKGLKVWGSFFALAEGFNRKATFIAAYEMAREFTPAQFTAAGVSNPMQFAEKAIAETQGVYNRGNRPVWARGAIGATLFTFKQFSVSYLEFVKRLPPKQKAIALATLVLAAGTQGLPFAEDIEDLIDTIGQSLGYNTNSKAKLKQWASNLMGEKWGDFVMDGASSLPGMPIDVQGRLGMSNLIPGTAILKPSNPDKLKEAFEAVGPLGALVNSLTRAVGQAQQGDWRGIATGALPVAVQNAVKGIDMEQSGFYRNAKGMNVVKTDDLDAFVKGIGFTPRNAADAQQVTSAVLQDVNLNHVMQGQIVNRWAQGVVQNDPARIADAMRAMQSWNAKNPESVIRITPSTIQAAVKQMVLTQDVRTMKNAPAALRGGVATAFLPLHGP